MSPPLLDAWEPEVLARPSISLFWNHKNGPESHYDEKKLSPTSTQCSSKWLRHVENRSERNPLHTGVLPKIFMHFQVGSMTDYSFKDSTKKIRLKSRVGPTTVIVIFAEFHLLHLFLVGENYNWKEVKRRNICDFSNQIRIKMFLMVRRDLGVSCTLPWVCGPKPLEEATLHGVRSFLAPSYSVLYVPLFLRIEGLLDFASSCEWIQRVGTW